jgi:hypothetical protein
MKNTQLLLKSAYAFLLILLSASAHSQAVQAKLEYMIKEDFDRIKEIAVFDRKPVLVYVNSAECSDSKRFSREIMNDSKVKSFLRKNFTCMNASVQTKKGKAMAKKHSVLMMPAIFLYSNDEVLYFPCSIKLDTAVMMDQFRSFCSATRIRELALLQIKTSRQSQNEVLVSLAKSFASTYIKKSEVSDLSELTKSLTLDLPYFRTFNREFIAEWEYIKSTGNRSEEDNESANN